LAGAGRLLKIAGGAAISVALLAYVFWSVDLHEVAERLRRTHWGWLALSGALNLAAVWVRARRWRYLFPPETHPSRLFPAVMIGFMGNNVLPLRAGEVLRVYVVHRHGQPFWPTAATVVVERVLDALAIGLMLAALIFVVPIRPELRWSALLFMSVDLLALAALLFMAAAPHACRRTAAALVGWWPRLLGLMSRILDTFDEGLRGLRARRHLLPMVAWSAGIWVTLALAVWTAFLAADLHLPFAAAWVVLAFLGLGVSLPTSPGFVGVVQVATVLALELFGVPRAEALSFSLLLHAAAYVPVTAWGLLLLAVEQVSLREAAVTASGPSAAGRTRSRR
jgi:uncharacterized protein (TIRG00374 family)